jgi:hypothetical protein
VFRSFHGLFVFNGPNKIVCLKVARKLGVTDAEIEKLRSIVIEKLGDARSFILDSPRSRAPRIEALRKARS